MDIGAITHVKDILDTGAGGIDMVFVKVREVYDLHTVQNKMTVIGIHTPKPDIIKSNFPGLLMQCKAYRPYSCDVRLACASVLPLDPQGVGLAEGDVAPEDVFNPILYKACTNFGMSQLEARIAAMVATPTFTGADTVSGNTADAIVQDFTTTVDEFPIYYGLLSNCHGWKQAAPQSGLSMTNLKPLVYEVLSTVGDNGTVNAELNMPTAPTGSGTAGTVVPAYFRGNSKPLPFINCTMYTATANAGTIDSGFQTGSGASAVRLKNAEVDVPYVNCLVGAILVPPSRLHELFYRMVVEWTIEFSSIRPLGEITNWNDLGSIGNMLHIQNYDYSAAKKMMGVDAEIMDNDTCMVSTNVDIQKVM